MSADPVLTAADARRLPQQRLRDEYESTGMVEQAFTLADRGVVPRLLADAQVFRAELRRLRRQGTARVPYILTESIREVAHDESITTVVGAILGDGVPIVMWGPNIRDATPNAAHQWHVDLESWLWPTITVVIGLAGSHDDSATRCIPHSQELRRAPSCAGDPADTARVLKTARALDPRCSEVRTFRGFGAGAFYVFNAKTWHRGHAAGSGQRVALFLHYQRADRPRIPYMRDYQRCLFDPVAAPFLDIGSDRASRRIQALPWRTRLRGWVGRLPGVR